MRIRHKFYQFMESSPIYTIINTLCNVCVIVEQVLLILPEHLSSSPVFGGVPVANF